MAKSGAVEEAVEALAVGVGRFLVGQDADGVRRTDATFLRPGRWVLPAVEGRVPRSAYLPGWRRIAERWGVLGALAGGSYAWWHDPEMVLGIAEYGGAAVAGLAAAGGGVYGFLTRRQRELMREWVVPLHQALARPLGVPEQTDPRRYLHVPLDFMDDDAQIRVDVPAHLRFDEQVVAELIVKKLGLEQVSVGWQRAGRDPHLTVRKRNLPPKVLRLSDPGVREILEEMPESAPLIGLGANKARVSVDLDAESPHVLISASTGGGKSTILRCITCQFLHNGAEAVVLDYKRISHGWVRGVPGVTYCRDIAEIHDALIRLGEEGRRRIRMAEDLGDDVLDQEPERVGPRIVILLEEVNATMRQLTRYWEKLREPGDPKTSPAVDALAEILFMGRQVRLHVLLVAQSATARALGGPEMRENFATRILVRYTLNAWRMLVPEVVPAPKPTSHPGRVQVVRGGRAHETQVLLLSDAEAREWAMGGVHVRGRPVKSLTQQLVPLIAARGSVPGGPGAAEKVVVRPGGGPVVLAKGPGEPGASGGVASPSSAAPSAADRPVGLREAQEEFLSELTLASLRWARANDPEFPEHVAKRGAELLYAREDLARWARNRPRAAVDAASDVGAGAGGEGETV
ncbi:DUF87 domain-containing protein [Streptomyces sp. SID8014]|uniref:helicase HerA domain-containing protein n=1 Tax=Streptomyces sp. SID8014 TaxID=2706097 RepID=UPI0013BE8A12|nr:DUF87 domain-containing protein [Streptomyces sp. SID8014]NEC12533.1 DUF87 domain-containing protein [Streptomyces sp. SID8014]